MNTDTGPTRPAADPIGEACATGIGLQGAKERQALSLPLVSIVTPAYNEEKHLSECIESVLSQTYTNWDYTIVDNCSTDETLAIAKKYAAADPRIRVVANSLLVPAVDNFNIALRQISNVSKYCKMVLADDWIFPDCLERMVAVMEEYPTVGVVGAYGLLGRWVLWTGLPYPSTVVPGREIGRQRLLGGPYVFGSQTSVLFRSDLVRAHDPFFNASNDHSDSEACLALLKECDFGFVHQVLTFSRERAGTSLLSKSKDLNTLAASLLHELVAYGPYYLDADEYSRRVGAALSGYYDFLARSLLRWRNKDFWKYHERKLKENGFSFSRVRLAGAFGKLVARAFVKLLRTSQHERYWGLGESSISSACK
jgi:glycosyltransferase involved in cell wall biosynthesis